MFDKKDYELLSNKIIELGEILAELQDKYFYEEDVWDDLIDVGFSQGQLEKKFFKVFGN